MLEVSDVVRELRLTETARIVRAGEVVGTGL